MLLLKIDFFYIMAPMIKANVTRCDSPAEILHGSLLASRGESNSGVLWLIQKVSKALYCSDLITLWTSIQAKNC